MRKYWSAILARVWGALSNRSLIGSDIVILFAIGFHVYEACVIATSTAANGSIGIHSLLALFYWNWLVATVLVLAACLGAYGQWGTFETNRARLKWLIPQLWLLVITSGGAIEAVLNGHYADGVPRSWMFISVDQYPRIAGPAIYAGAILARVRAT